MVKRGAGAGEHTLSVFLNRTASFTDDDYRRLANGGTLNREDLAVACGFGSRSTLISNRDVKLALAVLEEKLRAKGILAARAPRTSADAGSNAAEAPKPQYDATKDKRVASAHLLDKLQKQIAEKDARIAELESRLRQYAVMTEVLRETGRVPR